MLREAEAEGVSSAAFRRVPLDTR
eukprot:gene27251-biopygen17778